MIKNKDILVPFPFDDLSGKKVRPAVCLTNEIGPYNHVILAFITSRIPDTLLETDIIIESTDPDFFLAGYKGFIHPSTASSDDHFKIHASP